MTKRARVQQTKLNELEGEFARLLLARRRECAQGRYGLFGQNDHVDPEGRYYNWPEARRLQSLAQEIKSIRLDFGQPNQTCDWYLELCSLTGRNVSGEPKLARKFLNEIDQR